MPHIADFDSPLVAEPLQTWEVHRLWPLVDGAIMRADTRVELRRSWGLCARHAWAMALVELECRGAPLATTVLYADLAGGASALLDGAWHGPFRHLRARGRCPACADARRSAGVPSQWRERTRTVNAGRRFCGQLDEIWDDAVVSSCPACTGGGGPICRPHLLAGVEPADDLAKDVRRLMVRIRAYEKSLVADPRAIAAPAHPAWLHTLGWFAGWRFPAESIRAARHGQLSDQRFVRPTGRDEGMA